MLRCTFCGKTQLEVGVLLTNGNAHICEPCVVMFVGLLRDDRAIGEIRTIIDVGVVDVESPPQDYPQKNTEST